MARPYKGLNYTLLEFLDHLVMQVNRGVWRQTSVLAGFAVYKPRCNEIVKMQELVGAAEAANCWY